jgi:hypothetical protein
MWKRWVFPLVVWPAFAALALGAGCADYVGDFGRNCTAEELAEYGCGYCPVTCRKLGGAGLTDGGVGASCDGQCVPGPPVNWDGPLLLWTGPGPEIPECPPQARGASGGVWVGDLKAPPAACGACSCASPIGSCVSPVTFTTSSLTCPGDGSMAAHFAFDAPGGWDGACTSTNALDAGKVCGGAFCIASLTIAPLTKTAGTCTPETGTSSTPLAPPTWETLSAVCPGATSGSCNRSDLTCMPANEPGFERCVYRPGDAPCAPDSQYTIRHVLYTGLNDTRGCAPCTCGDVVGSSCSAKVSVFSDPICTDLVGTYSIDATGSKCFDLPPGIGLGSKSASSVTYTPGFCQPGGGGPTGFAEPIDPTTFCCLPAP